MVKRSTPILLIVACFACLALYIAINDVNYRLETEYRDVQIKTFKVYADWNQYIGTLRGLTTTTVGFGQTLGDAAILKIRTESLIAELKVEATRMNAETREPLEAFVGIIEAGLRYGQELTENGRNLLAQPDLPLVYREGRLPLSSLTGKDVTAVMGTQAAYQYYQLIRRLKGMNVLFDRLYSDRVSDILESIATQSERMRRAFFYLRIALLALTLACVALLVIQLYRLNVFLRNLAESAKRELVIARTNLSEVQGFLQNARFQRSLFEMVAGLAHELNTPLGNCLGATSHVEAKVADLRAGVRAGGLSRDGFDRAMGESLEGLALARVNLDQMRFQIETFKRLSSVNAEGGSAPVPLSAYLAEELPRLAAGFPPLRVRVSRLGEADPQVRADDLNQILSQLMDNSREHGEAREARVSIGVEGDELVLRYEDDGKGAPDEIIDRIAEPFVTTARGRYHMGLGLPIVVSLITHKLGGTVSFSNGYPGVRAVAHVPLDGSSPA